MERGGTEHGVESGPVTLASDELHVAHKHAFNDKPVEVRTRGDLREHRKEVLEYGPRGVKVDEELEGSEAREDGEVDWGGRRCVD